MSLKTQKILHHVRDQYSPNFHLTCASEMVSCFFLDLTKMRISSLRYKNPKRAEQKL